MKGPDSDHHHVNTGQINGGRGIDRNSNPAARVEHHKHSAWPSGWAADSAAISDSGRDTLSAAKAMTERLETEPEDRLEVVESARRLLRTGELDQPEVFLETARRLLRDGF